MSYHQTGIKKIHISGNSCFQCEINISPLHCKRFHFYIFRYGRVNYDDIRILKTRLTVLAPPHKSKVKNIKIYDEIMVVHVFIADWYHLSPGISKGFVTTYKKDAKPFILLKGDKNTDWDKYSIIYKDAGFNDYVFCQSFMNFCFYLFRHRKDAILFHFAYYHWLIAAFALGCKNVNWVCWGTGAIIRNSRKSRLIAPLKRILYNKLKTIVTLMDPDRISIINDFNVSPKHIKTIPYSSLSEDESPKDIMCKKYANMPKVNNSKPLVFLGNSPMCLGSYIELVEKLKKYSGKIRILCMMNYSVTKNDQYYKLLEKGKKFYGEDFVIDENFYEGDENYVAYMNTCDIYICGVERQSGLGAIETCLKLGKKVYITGKNLDWIKTEFDPILFTIDEINGSYPFINFIAPLSSQQKEYNYKCMISRKSHYRNLWHMYLKSIDSNSSSSCTNSDLKNER